ncbi:hypothetical protein [Pedobacter nutrimenti]|uniref:hypothetical protein n=1 Tax=Pedobacter nutrimenti TaxID=1241337 RepID=UPI00292EBD55|nr:hypothetical protein [Pedobacter nutrimenti]
MFKVRIHRKTPTKKNPQILVAVMCGNVEDQGTFQRVFKYRGIDPFFIAERNMTASEKLRTEFSWRLQWYSYKNWKELILDEWEVTEDHDWVKKLFVLSGLKGAAQDIINDIKS